MKIDVTIKRETRFVALFVCMLSCLMQAVFLLIGKWSLAVLWANLYSGALAVLNFFLMGLTIQKALSDDVELAQKRIKASQSYRLFATAILLAIAAFLGAKFGVFNIVALIVPMFFVRVSMVVRGVMLAKSGLIDQYEPIPYDDDEEEGGDL